MEAKRRIGQFPLREAWLILAIGFLMLLALGGGYALRFATSPNAAAQQSSAATQSGAVTNPGPGNACIVFHGHRGC